MQKEWGGTAASSKVAPPSASVDFAASLDTNTPRLTAAS